MSKVFNADFMAKFTAQHDLTAAQTAALVVIEKASSVLVSHGLLTASECISMMTHLLNGMANEDAALRSKLTRAFGALLKDATDEPEQKKEPDDAPVFVMPTDKIF